MEEQNNETLLSDKISILSEFWLRYKTDEEFLDFVEYNDLGLPLAFALNSDIVKITPEATGYIEETFELLLDILEIDEEGPWETLDDMLGLDRSED